MKTENNRHPSVIPHRRYPSLSDDFGRERGIPNDLPGLSGAPGPDAIVRMVYLRLLIALGTKLIVAAIVASA
jgi:hypothetical protein